MARATNLHRFRAVTRHEDGTDCHHKLTPRGYATEEGCTGRSGYHAECSCGGWSLDGTTKAALEYSHSHHHRPAAKA